VDVAEDKFLFKETFSPPGHFLLTNGLLFLIMFE